jgi:uncharacterized protein (TIGR03086 family)
VITFSEPTAVTDLLAMNRRAVERSVEIVDAVTSTQLSAPTPCEGWSLGDLLGHMIAQHRGFAAAAAGNVDDQSVWRMRPVIDWPAGAYRVAARAATSAFAGDGVLSRGFWLPEIRDGGPFPGHVAIGFHLLDYVVHGWDVAASIGAKADYPNDLVDVALALAELVPDGASRQQVNSAFGPALAVADARTPMEGLLLILGRDPAWTPVQIPGGSTVPALDLNPT